MFYGLPAPEFLIISFLTKKGYAHVRHTEVSR